jgi:hypothetical protein
MKIQLTENQVTKLAIQGNQRIKNAIFKIWNDIGDNDMLFSQTHRILGFSPETFEQTTGLGHKLSMYYLEWKGGIDENGNLDFSKLEEELFKPRTITASNLKIRLNYEPFDYEIENDKSPYDILVKIKIWESWGGKFKEYYKDFGDDSQVVQDVLYDIYEELNNEIYKKTGFFVITIMEYVD